MKNLSLLLLALLFLTKAEAQSGNDSYYTTVYFSPNYQIGDCIEFVKVSPYDAGASGNFEISISYTRGNVAAAATHLASISHANAPVWRETGRINNNGFTNPQFFNFTIDCNGQYGNPRFRIRAVNTIGVLDQGIYVNIKIRPINFNNSWTALNVTGNDLSVNKMQPMTDEWNLYVGNAFSSDGAKIAIKADALGNVGVGTATPDEKLTVKGKIHAEEVKVDLVVPAPDYVFDNDYPLIPLSEIQNYIKENKHLPEVPSAKEMEKKGINLSEMNILLLKKVEELTLHLIKQEERIEILENNQKKITNQNSH